MKTCRNCRTPKETSDFGIDTRNVDNLKGICKDCEAEKERNRRKMKSVPEGYFDVDAHAKEMLLKERESRIEYSKQYNKLHSRSKAA
jgi:hypothetical protein